MLKSMSIRENALNVCNIFRGRPESCSCLYWPTKRLRPRAGERHVDDLTPFVDAQATLEGWWDLELNYGEPWIKPLQEEETTTWAKCIVSWFAVAFKQGFEGFSWKTMGDALKDNNPKTPTCRYYRTWNSKGTPYKAYHLYKNIHHASYMVQVDWHGPESESRKLYFLNFVCFTWLNQQIQICTWSWNNKKRFSPAVRVREGMWKEVLPLKVLEGRKVEIFSSYIYINLDYHFQKRIFFKYFGPAIPAPKTQCCRVSWKPPMTIFSRLGRSCIALPPASRKAFIEVVPAFFGLGWYSSTSRWEIGLKRNSL